MTEPEGSSQVVIVGAGPVGLTAALVLARRGVAVTVLESGLTLSRESRASTFHPPTLEMLAALEVYDDLAEQGLVAEMFQYRDISLGVVAELDLRALADDTPYPFRIQCEQSKLTAILLGRLADEPTCTVCFDAQVVEVESNPAAVTVRTADGRSWTAPWLIGADGAHSAVRRGLGIEFEGVTYPETFLVVSTTEPIEEHILGIAPVNYVFGVDHWVVLLRTPEHWRVLLPIADGDEAASSELDERRTAARLTEVADLGRPWAISHLSRYRVHQRVAASFRQGNGLLLGDAAHVNNPLGGMGMNSGIHDAVIIAQTLADVIAGAAPDASLTAAADVWARVARDFVGRNSHANWERLRNADLAAREQVYADLRTTASTPELARQSLLTSSMITSLRPVQIPSLRTAPDDLPVAPAWG